ncbi:MAG: ABC transporter permease [Smithellaceae bacterium]|jgi:putative ABC transport system permease protein|nr:ABC transporter permease [Smithellaceae bacterium]MDD3258090.1 ABC transporter permease [Smithellaceae bacterium]MDD3848051.1 ABC transporter permease [Smithellaceae bacterium]HOG11895.1 ABC transporter permease [Smithellaceae bacterium]HOQ71570.1 ABC transporter permease [Smithellaceae bacterium]
MINFLSTAKISLRALRANKMRSALTMLGIIIGVAAVITMLAVGRGASNKISEQIATVGSNLIIVLPGSTTASGIRLGSGAFQNLTRADAEAIRQECSAVATTAPILNGSAQIIYGNANWPSVVFGTDENMLEVRDWTLSAGRNFYDQEIRSAAKVCLLGQTVVDNLFGNDDPLHKTVRIKKVPFVVIGVLAPKGQSMMGQDQDDIVYAPVSAAQRNLFGRSFPGTVRSIMVKAKSTEDLDRAEQQIKELLRQRHRIGAGQEDDFTVRNLTQMMQMAEQASRVMALLLAAIAGVSLLVGGIGIMNIMLVSVTERTREIGIRMAVGAKTWDIRLQFIIEAMILSLIGGLIGVLLGILFAELLSFFAGWTILISTYSILLSFGFSGLVGIFFGFYPAYKASLMNPIDALRHE